MQLSEVIKAYEASCRANNLTVSTMRSKTLVHRRLLAATGNIESRNIRPQHLDALWRSVEHLSPASKNITRAHLKVLFEWMRARQYLGPSDPLQGTRRLRSPRRNYIIIPQEEFSTFISGARNPRARIVLAIGLYLFPRVGEIESFRWQDDLGETMYVWRQKTQTEDHLPICAELREELDRWKWDYGVALGARPQPFWHIVPGVESGRFVKGGGRSRDLWIPERRGPLRHTIQQELIRGGYYQEREGGHTLRRSGATALYVHLSQSGHDQAVRACQWMLGHSSMSHTETYLDIGYDRKALRSMLGGKPMFGDKKEDAHVLSLHGGGSEAGDRM